MGIEFHFCKKKRVMDMDGDDGFVLRMYLIQLNCTLKNVASKFNMYFNAIIKEL